MNGNSTQNRNRLIFIGLPLVIVFVAGGVALWNRESLMQFVGDVRQKRREGTVATSKAQNQPGKRSLFELVPEKKETFRLVNKSLDQLGINVYTIESNPPPTKLRLPGALTFDPNRFIRVHSRFPGEVRGVGKAKGTNRPLQFGDTVAVGDLLATIWSKDIGEKKSELVDAFARVQFDKIVLDRLNSLPEVVAKKAITEAERTYQGDMVAFQKAERTLRSWNFSEQEIEAVRLEAKEIIELIKKLKNPDPIADKDHSLIQAIIADDGRWAELDIFAAQAGVIADKNFNVGDMIDTTNVLFRIADIDRIQVLANVFEEDVPALRALSKEERKWTLELKSESFDTPIPGHFDQIGIIVDSKMHTLPVLGYIENPKRHFAIGQFITATIEIPGDPTQVVIPVAAVVEEGSTSIVFVETNAELREYTRRQIAVKSRGRTMIHVSMEPEPYQIENGIQPLRPGERVLINSVVELDAELNDMVSSSPKN